MTNLVRWLLSESAALAVYATVLLSIAVMAVAPRIIRMRLRTSVFLGVAFSLMNLLLPPMVSYLGGRDFDDLRALTGALGALAVTRFAFVVVVDLLFERAGRSPMNALVRDVIQAGLYFLVLVVALRVANMQPSSLIATGTVATAVIGLALQETLGNLAAGVAIQVEQPVGVGDWIRLEKGDVLGRVVNMNWRAVTIETDDRSVFVIPNGVFSKTAFMNYSRPGGLMRRNLYITVPYDVSPSVVQDAIESACRDCKDILLEPSPSVLTWNFTERGIIYWLRYWISDFNRRDSTQADIYKRVWYQFHRRKIPHALPGSHMFMHKMDGKAREEREAEVIMDRRSAIDTVDFLRPLSEKGKSTLAERGHRRLFSTGEKILHQGDVGRTFYMVRRGQVAVTVDGIEARSLGPGEFFGELALLTGRERHASVVAKAETEVFEIDEVMFRDVLKDEPEIAETVSAIVAKRQAEIASLRAAEGKPTPNDVKNMSAEILRKLKTLFAID